MGIETLPDSIVKAIQITENSELVKKALGERVISRFVNIKQKYWDDYRVQMTKYELDKFLPIL